MVAAPRITIDEFLRALRGTNPFTRNRVSHVADTDVDVPAIHDAEFSQLARRVEQVRRGETSVGLVVLGGAGVGKSHLLVRLSRWAHRESCATLVFLHNVVASPERMPRYLLRATVSLLAGSRPNAYRESELYNLLHRAVTVQLAREGQARMPPVALRVSTLERLGREVDPDGEVTRVFIAFLQAAAAETDGGSRDEECAHAAVTWLSGETISGEAAAELGVRPLDEDGAAMADDVGIERAFCVLAHLAGIAERPLVLCIDQVDNLTDDKVGGLCAFLHVLIDHAPHLLVVVSGVRQSMLRFVDEGVIPQAAWDRLAQHKVELRRIDAREARALARARTNEFVRPFRDLPEVRARRGKDELFPLDESWLQKCLEGQTEFRPRDLITWARDRWEEQQFRLDERGAAAWLAEWPGRGQSWRPPEVHQPRSVETAIDELARMKILERMAERQLRPDTLPPDADNLATLVSSLLGHCLGDSRYSLVGLERCARGKRVPIYDLVARERRTDGVEVTSGVLFVTSENKTKVAHALRRLLDDPTPPHHRILVTDEQRRPLALGPRGQEHYQALRKLGKDAFLHSKFDFDDHAMLDALFGFIGSARVGDLEIEFPRGQTRPIAEAEAVEALHRKNHFVAHPLLREILTEEVTSRPKRPSPVVSEKRARETIAARLSWRLGLTSREVTQEFIELEHLEGLPFETIHSQIKIIARGMHEEGTLHATAQDDALFLQLMNRKPPDEWDSSSLR